MRRTGGSDDKVLSPDDIRNRALMGASWFVNTQIVSRPPAHDANHGRVVYNYHMPTGALVRGLSWSHGRAIMCLLGSWELSSGRQEYLDAAIRCGIYLTQALQVMDQRNKRSYGCFREEIPASEYCYPRDAIEGAFGLLMLYVATGKKDYIERCTIFADWYLREAVDRRVRWPRGTVHFEAGLKDKHSMKFFQAGGAPFFWHLYGLTGRKRYLTDGLKMMADGLVDRFIDPATGAMISTSKDAHHSIAGSKSQIAINDDGALMALTCGCRAFPGKSGRRYLDAAVAYADWLMNKCPRPIPLFAAPGLHVVDLTEVAALTGRKTYTRFARELMAHHVRNQVVAPRRLDRHGAFRGEDEDVKWYVEGAKPADFLTTRATAYGTLALLRLAGVIGPAYSAFGMDRFVSFARKRT